MSKIKKKQGAVATKPLAAGQHAVKSAPVAQPHKPAVPQVHREVYMAFHRNNYLIVAFGALLLVIGYALMVGGGTDPNHPEIFDAAAKYSFVRITLSPIIIVTGLLVIAFAIMYKQKEEAPKAE